MLHGSAPIPYCKNNYFFQMDNNEEREDILDSDILQDCSIDSTRKHEEELEDVYSQLAQKERDLVLAAELGKALLEENNLLLQKQEDFAQEIQQVKEVSEQEKYELRRQLEQLQTEFDNRLLDLQDEVISQKDEQANHEAVMRSSDRKRQEIIDDLMEQNQRLAVQLKQASQTEIELHNEVEKLREQVNVKKSTMHSHTHLLETLREEVEILTTAKSEMEKRLSSVIEERNSLNCSIEETNDKAHMWERQNRETEAQLRLRDSELKELREHNQQLSEQVENFKLKMSLGESFQGSNSLMAELENELSMSMPVSNYSSGFKLGDYDEIECDEDFEDDGGSMEVEMPPIGHAFAQDNFGGIYTQLLQLFAVLKDDNLEDDDDVDDEFGAITEKTVLDLIQEIKQLVQAKISNISNSESDSIRGGLEIELKQMREELYIAYGQLEALRTEIDRQDKELRQKSIEVEAVTSKVTSFDEHFRTHDISHLFLSPEKVAAAHQISEHDSILQELELKQEDNLSKDLLIFQLQEERDKAQARIDKSEKEIEITKKDLMALDAQLLSTIQQKATLSHQLDEWQVDIHELLNKRLKSELSKQEEKYQKQQQASSSTDQKKAHSSPRRFSLWPSTR
ncbi:bicaudal D-related protein homolog isoform X2 [Anneissia japonica]|uniref:bicaudal D-related protein homolog isoform X2 n=1 Tax=Anneissia japonica TaxID=1529436 RepID=UPI00142597EB|nr:bicaudal D-related protein homolog isoform X2 [Anneissia japonica]